MFARNGLLLSILVLLFLPVMAACQTHTLEHDQKTPANVVSPSPQSNQGGTPVIAITEPVIAGKGTVELKGSRISVQVWLVKGKEVTDSEPGPYQGTYLQGTYEVTSSAADGKELARLGLNGAFDGGELMFRKSEPFLLQFDDYNEDGNPDFAIGQRSGSNGSMYSIITVKPDGFAILQKSIYSADHRESIRYRKVGDHAFLNIYYDQRKGYMEEVYRWKEGAFHTDEPVEAKEVRSAGEDGEAEQVSVWWDGLCPEADQMVKEPKSDAGSITGQWSMNTENTATYQEFLFQLPEGWTFENDRIMKDGQLLGRLQTYVYQASERKGYPSFLAESASVYRCKTGLWHFGETREYEVAGAKLSIDGEPEVERHYQFFEYGPKQHKVYDFTFFSQIDQGTAGHIASTINLNRESERYANEVKTKFDADPRLHSPVRALVAPGEQHYTITFAEPMDRASVEAAIRAEGIVYGPDHAVKTTGRRDRGLKGSIDADFEWESDHQLHVSVQSTMAANNGHMYSLTVKGALTASGKLLKDPPVFYANLGSPEQLWQISADSGEMIKLTSFASPYRLEMLGGGRYLLLETYKQYCECDAQHGYYFDLYDIESGERTKVPFDLWTNYVGNAPFYADSRGFFYAGDPAKMSSGEKPVRIQVEGYVHGAALSNDRRFVLMAVGTDRDDVKDLDFVVYSLADGKEARYPAALKGRLEESLVSTALLPVHFYDDGRYAYTEMWEKNHVRYYRYDWEKGTIQDWTPPLPGEKHVLSYLDGTLPSADGEYTVHFGAGLLKNGKVVDPAMHKNGQWVGETHQYAYVQYVEEDGKSAPQLMIYDADAEQSSILVGKLRNGSRILGSSVDGKWIYVAG